VKFRSSSPTSGHPRRGSRLRLCEALLVAGCLAALGSSAPASQAPLLGVDLDLAAIESGQRQARATALEAAGARSLRWSLAWNRVERQPGNFDWRADDEAVDAALAAGLDVVLVLGACAEWAVDPAWNVPPDQRRSSVPMSLASWRRYVRNAASHFKGRVRYWQVREQPNGRNFRGARSEYLSLLESASEEVRGVDPTSQIILPESGVLDIAAVDHALKSPQQTACDIFGVSLPPKFSDSGALLVVPPSGCSDRQIPSSARPLSAPT
jgi:hypothetical protein